ncbi:hypothetical protein J2T49_001730 [Pseudomonas nitroreducens]|nr:hypothetical protein [Pseudomonas nitroreducens]MCP1685791.1 hypothetical protein [Pseudomonas nitroreducens]
MHFRPMIGYVEPPSEEETEAHAQEVVALFLKAFRP